MPSRRRLLAGLGAASLTALAGCGGVGDPTGPAGEGDTTEIIVVNATDAAVRLAVRLEDERGDPLFSRVYRLDPRHTDQSAGIDAVPTTVTAFTPSGASSTWTFSPEMDCPGPDAGVTLAGPDTIEAWSGC